jgi:hypothetical protein
MNFTTRQATLACHLKTPSRAVRGIDVEAGVTPAGGLTPTFALAGDLSAVRIPEPRPFRRTGGLWRHTCFEAFVKAGEGPAYRELNFSPSGGWAVYAFRGYREGEAPVERPEPAIAVRRRGDRLELNAEIPPDALPPGRSLRLGLSAVVEANGALSFWALRHPPGRPDFHHADAFALSLVMPAMPDVDILAGAVRL